jgi:signal transduction histidine kinase
MSDELLKTITTRLAKQASVQRQAEQKMESLRYNIIRSMPHELNTPLNGIIGFTDILLSELDSLKIAEIREMLGYISISSHRLYKLVSKFLFYMDLEIIANDVNKLKSFKDKWTYSTENHIQKQAFECVKKLKREADLQLDIQDYQIQMAGANINKLVEELLDNACKFSHAGTPITISSQVKNNIFFLSVNDQGRGMSNEQIVNIGAYMQFDRKLYEQQGSGLGLIIAKRLAEIHGGQLIINSILSKCTTVTVAIPVKRCVRMQESGVKIFIK